MTQTKTLKKNIMRRVFYAYTLRVAVSRLVLNSALLSVGLILLARNVHVARVWETFVSQPVGQVPRFITSTLMQGEVLTLLSLLFIGASSIMIASALLPLRHLITYREQWL